MFRDREDAAAQLAERLLEYRDRRPVVLALPRGGVPVGRVIAYALHAPLDLVLVRKVGAPDQPELAVAAVVAGGHWGSHPHTVYNRDIMAALGLTTPDVTTLAGPELAEIERRRRLYLHGRAPIDLTDRTAIVVDDGIATGATMRAALDAVRGAGAATVVLAVPVAPPDTIEQLRPLVDEVVCLVAPKHLMAISMWYDRFPQLGDDAVVALLDSAEIRRVKLPGADARAP